MKSILLQLGNDPDFESRFQGALDLARYTSGHLECLQTRRVPAFLGSDAAGFAGSAAMVVQLMEDEGRLAEAERAAVSKRLDGEGVPYSFVESMGDPAQTLVDRSLLSDVIVMSMYGLRGGMLLVLLRMRKCSAPLVLSQTTSDVSSRQHYRRCSMTSIVTAL
jgi:hypothetical protein